MTIKKTISKLLTCALITLFSSSCVARKGEKENHCIDCESVCDIIANFQDKEILDKSICCTVGETGSTFSSIQQALDFLDKYRPLNNVRVTLKLDSNYVVKEQILVDGVDLSWIEIESESEDVLVDGDYLTEMNLYVPSHFESSFEHYYSAVGMRCLFSGINGANLPTIKTLFRCKNGTNRIGVGLYNGSNCFIADRCGFMSFSNNAYIIEDSTLNAMGALLVNALETSIKAFRSCKIQLGAGKCSGRSGLYADVNTLADIACADFRGCSDVGLEVGPGSSVNAIYANFSGCNVGLEAYNGGRVVGREIIATDCKYRAVNCQGGAEINACSSIFTGAASQAVYVQNGGQVICDGADLSGAGVNGISCNGGTVHALNANCRMKDNDDPCDIHISNGGIVYANGATGGTYTTPNEVSDRGVIWK